MRIYLPLLVSVTLFIVIGESRQASAQGIIRAQTHLVLDAIDKQIQNAVKQRLGAGNWVGSAASSSSQSRDDATITPAPRIQKTDSGCPEEPSQGSSPPNLR